MERKLPKGFTWEAVELALDRALSAPYQPGPTTQAGATPPLVVKLEAIVQQAVAELRKELGRAWLPNSIFGTRLHAKVRELMNAAKWPSGWNIFVEEPIKMFAKLPAPLLNRTVGAYLDEQGPPAHLKPSLSRVLDRNGRIGDLKPDLVITAPDGRMIVWDLTSREREEHVAKTLLYTILLTPDNHLTHVGETYWLRS